MLQLKGQINLKLAIVYLKISKTNPVIVKMTTDPPKLVEILKILSYAALPFSYYQLFMIA